ncbi:FAD binding domain-containing protein [Streptomyces sp. 1114.5]|uniref:FAD-binding oxidoreductase n=1 Tax=Streptomyces sp. 1114.5 TaxID=1938830 RepID=UPI000EB074B9|nr:FAD-dependent oxidoreductase [Streptomyces sp. 1114.5]RKT19432.1 FAD binding domain-containing protein [Streptomyces sp. 1114.5]
MTESEQAVALPGEPAFAAASAVFNLAAPVRPAAAVTVRTVEQVRAALRHAERLGQWVRVHTTGHASSSARPMDRSLLIRTEPAGPVEVDPVARTARIPAGTRWGEVVEAAAKFGLAAPHGSSPTVGVVGYLLRGGISFYGRRAGLAVNSVRVVELVTPDGEFRRVSASEDPELFWALRGGGGGLGIVTAIELGLFPAARVVTGAAFWPAAHGPELLSRWLRWSRGAPEAVTTVFRVMNLPKVPEIPSALTAGPVVCAAGVVLAPAEEDLTDAEGQAADLLGPLRAVADPVLDTWCTTTPPAVVRTHMDPTDPVPVLGDHLLLSDLGEEGAEAFLRVLGEGSGSPLVNAELRQLGGALAVPDPDGGALSHLDAAFAFTAGGLALDPAASAAVRAHCAKARAALAPWDTGRTAPTLVERLEQPQRHLSAAEVERVDAVRRRVDPAGRLRHDVPPGACALY